MVGSEALAKQPVYRDCGGLSMVKNLTNIPSPSDNPENI
jgi:hypothetical protein